MYEVMIVVCPLAFFLGVLNSKPSAGRDGVGVACVLIAAVLLA